MDRSILNQVKSFARNRCLPVIPIKAKDVTIINDPDSFYKLILEQSNLCKKRLGLSALYLGTGSKEKAIVQEICDNLSREQNLSVNLALDAHRATRKDVRGISSLITLKKILPHKRVSLSLIETRIYKSPLDHLLGKFPKWNELSSTFHTKFLIFDDDIIVTGANLSDIYFENRQDRYMLIKNSKLLSDYVSNLLELFDNISRTNIVTPNLRKLNEQFNGSMSDDDSDTTDSYIIPLVQFGSRGQQDKEDFLLFLNSILPPEAKIHLSSGYFNPSNAINRIKINSVLAPSESANGFFNGGLLLKYVPRLYSVLHQEYLDNHQSCKLFYYNKPGWSFHAKGIWVTGLEDLYIHVIGSSNFNHRSSKRDLETELVLLTKDKNLSQSLETERLRLWSESDQINRNSETFNPIYRVLAKLFESFL